MKNDAKRELSGKTALITGASKGLGKAMALSLAEAGAHIALVSRDAEKLGEVKREIEQAGGNAEVFTADVSDEQSVNRLQSELADKKVQILINNAGINIRKQLHEFSLEEWQRVIDRKSTGLNSSHVSISY